MSARDERRCVGPVDFNVDFGSTSSPLPTLGSERHHVAGCLLAMDEPGRWILVISPEGAAATGRHQSPQDDLRLRLERARKRADAERATHAARVRELEQTIGELRVELEYCMSRLTMHESRAAAEEGHRSTLEQRVTTEISRRRRAESELAHAHAQIERLEGNRWEQEATSTDLLPSPRENEIMRAARETETVAHGICGRDHAVGSVLAAETTAPMPPGRDG